MAASNEDMEGAETQPADDGWEGVSQEYADEGMEDKPEALAEDANAAIADTVMERWQIAKQILLH